MGARLKIDCSYSQEIRTTRVVVTARTGLNPPQLLLASPLPRRRHLRLRHFGQDGNPTADVPLVIGDRDIRWVAAPLEVYGFELHLFEVVQLEVDESVQVYGILRDVEEAGVHVDLRIMEIA